MTRFFVNEREVPPPLDISSLDKILQQVEAVHLPPSSVVRQIQIDGIPLEGEVEELSHKLGQMENLEKVEIFTSPLVEVARDSITGALAYLDQIEAATPSLAASFQISPGPEAFHNLREFYNGFYWLTLDDIVVQNLSALDHCNKFNDIIKQLINSQERGDFVLVSDLLEYEILPLIPIWKEMLSAFAMKAGIEL
jgi:hypothetical protein